MGSNYQIHGSSPKHKGGRRKWIIVTAIIILIAGIGVISYPFIEQKVYENEIADLKRDFLLDVENPPPSDEPGLSLYDLLYEYLKAENQNLYETGQEGLTDAFSYQQPAVDLSSYGIKDNCIGFISLPSINMELPIYLGANNENMKKGAVHLTQTSYPIGGNNTNCVIAAHRGTSLVMFRNIHKIAIGDEIIITNFKEVLKYRAAKIEIIDPTDAHKLLIEQDRDMLTLFTCNPLGHNYQRYVLYCERITDNNN